MNSSILNNNRIRQARFKPDKREEGTKILADFFNEYKNQINGFIIMNSIDYSQ